MTYSLRLGPREMVEVPLREYRLLQPMWPTPSRGDHCIDCQQRDLMVPMVLFPSLALPLTTTLFAI